MTTKTPVRATFTGSNVTGLAEYQSGEFIPLTHGGLGASLSIGSAGQVLKVNGAGNAIEFGAVEAIVNIDNATDLESATLAVGDKILLSDGGTEGRVLLSQLDTLFSGTTKTLTNKTLTSPAINNPTITGGTFSGTFTGTMDATGMVLSGASPLVFEGATADASETTLAFVDPTTDRTITFPNATGTIVLEATGSTLTNKSIDLGNNTISGSLAEFNTALQDDSFAGLAATQTLTNKTLTSAVLNTGVSGSAILDEDDLSSNSATQLATQQSIKAYVDAISTTLTVAADSGSNDGVVVGTDTLTFAGGTGIDSTVSNNQISLAIDSTVATLTGTQTLTNKTLTSPTITGTGAIAGTFTGNITGDVTGNADTATALANARTIAGQSFDGTGNITIASTDLSNTAAIALLTASQTLTNKTLTTPVIAEIDATGDFTVDAVGDVILNADGADVRLQDDSVEYLRFTNSSGSAQIRNSGQDKDISFIVNDGGSTITALTIDSSEAGAVSLNGALTVGGNAVVTGNLTVNGTTTTLATTNSTITDRLIELGTGTTGTPGNDMGIVMERGDSNNAFMGWDESTDKFIVGTGTFTGASTGDLTITTGTLVANLEGNVTGNVTGNVSGTSGSTTGNAATATALQNARTIHGVSFDGTANIDLTEVVQDTVGAMFSSNTETGITVSYQDGDGTIDLVVGTLNQDTTGNAATATALETARTIAGQSFDGTGNITIASTDLSNTSAIALLTSTQTLTNKTLTTPTIEQINATNFLVDASTITLDASENRINLHDNGSEFGRFVNSGGNLQIKSSSSGTTAVTFDGANATFGGTIDSGTITTTGSIVFEGATADGNETTLTVVDPTADRTITFQNGSGTVAFLTDVTGGATPGNFTTITLDNNITFEGATDDAHETTLTVEDPTGDRTVTIPNATGQIVLRDTTDTLTNKTLTSPVIAAITSTADIDLTATNDVNIPANVGLTFGDDGEKIEGDGTDLTISSSRNVVIDADSAINLDADSNGTVNYKDGGSKYFVVSKSSSSAVLSVDATDGDMIFKGDDGGSVITALTLDMSDAGSATFNNNVAIGGNATVTGNLTVNGTTTTLATTNSVISDRLIELGNGTTGTPGNDMGIVLERGDSDNAFIGFDESTDKFIVGTGTFTGASTGNLTITTGTLVANLEGNVTGNVTGNVSGSSGSTTGNAATATALANARTIGGTSFDGTANIAVNLAATATTLATARNIGGVSFDGSANIDLPGVNSSGNQDTSGNAATATALANARTIAGQSFDGTGNITIASTDLSNTSAITLLTASQTLTNKTLTAPTINAATITGAVTFAGDVNFDSNTLFVDVSADKVGIGTNSPARSLEISQQIPVIRITDTDAPAGYMEMSGAGSEFRFDLDKDDALASSILTFRVDGEYVMKFRDGASEFADGSAANPSITNIGDINTGLFFSAADTMAFSAGGTSQFTMADGVIAPVTDSDVDLGTTSLRFKNAYIDSITGALTGNASTATTLANARTIAGQSFDGSANITIASTDLSNTSAIALLTSSQTLTNKTIALGSNTVSGTTAEFNSALSDGSFVTLAGTETLTNKTLTSPVINAFSGTGNASIAGTLSLTSTSTGDVLNITTTENSSTAGPVINLKRNSGSVADADYMGQIKFTGENDADQEQVYAKITGKIQDASDGSEDGLIEFANVKAGSQTITARLRSDSLQLLNGTSLSVAGDATITGDLTVNGTTTTVSTTNTVVSDSLLELGNGTSGSPSNDAGLVIERGDSDNAFIGYDESDDKFKVGTGSFTGASTGNLTVTTGTLVANLEGNVTGNVTGNVSGTAGSATGNAATATALESARTIGGVSFDGTANINLPGVNTSGSQDTSGNAATATILETARTIAGQSFNGSANITIASTDLSDTASIATLTGSQTLTNKSIDSDNNTITNIVNADIKSSAAIAFSKMADLTASRALASDSNGDVSVTSVTATELGYLDGVSSAIQTQLDAKQATIDSSNRLNANLINDGTVDNTEFGYLNGVTSAIQTQIDNKATKGFAVAMAIAL